MDELINHGFINRAEETELGMALKRDAIKMETNFEKEMIENLKIVKFYNIISLEYLKDKIITEYKINKKEKEEKTAEK